MRRLVWLLTILITVPTLAIAEEPTGFADLPWGTPTATALQRCNESGGPIKSILLGGEITRNGRSVEIAGERRAPSLKLEPEGALSGYQLYASRTAYAIFRAVLVEKFGPPTQEHVRRYETRRGQPVSGEQLIWTWESGTSAVLDEICSDLRHSCVLVMTKPYAEWLDQRAKEMKEKARKSF